MRTVIHKVNQFLSGFCGWLMLAMMILLVVDILGRTFKRPIQGMAELSVFVMMIVIYLGLARCEEHREHVNLEVVRNALPRRARQITELIAYVLALLTVGLLLYAVCQNALASFQKKEALEGTVELCIWPVKFVMVIGLFFFFIQTFINTLDVARKRDKSNGD